jgi:hypothetical protein
MNAPRHERCAVCDDIKGPTLENGLALHARHHNDKLLNLAFPEPRCITFEKGQRRVHPRICKVRLRFDIKHTCDLSEDLGQIGLQSFVLGNQQAEAVLSDRSERFRGIYSPLVKNAAVGEGDGIMRLCERLFCTVQEPSPLVHLFIA